MAKRCSYLPDSPTSLSLIFVNPQTLEGIVYLCRLAGRNHILKTGMRTHSFFTRLFIPLPQESELFSNLDFQPSWHWPIPTGFFYPIR